MSQSETVEAIRQSELVELYRQKHPAADRWAAGYGQIDHTPETQTRIFAMADLLVEQGMEDGAAPLFNRLYALDRVTSASMWLVVHQTYAKRVYLDGRDLSPDDFKTKPEGHTGGSLNRVPAYMGYMAINAITDFTVMNMTKQKWKIVSAVALVVATAFLIGAFTTGTVTLYAVAGSWFALAAIFGRKAERRQ